MNLTVKDLARLMDAIESMGSMLAQHSVPDLLKASERELAPHALPEARIQAALQSIGKDGGSSADFTRAWNDLWTAYCALSTANVTVGVQRGRGGDK